MQSVTALRSIVESSGGSTSVVSGSPLRAPEAIAVTFLPPSVAGMTTVASRDAHDVTLAVPFLILYLKYFSGVSAPKSYAPLAESLEKGRFRNYLWLCETLWLKNRMGG